MDIVDRPTRSRMMSGIRGKNTMPELTVRSFLHRAGLRFRLHAKLPGKPDLVFPKYRTVVFVHGCFWHRHEDCRYATTPASNPEFWQHKFAANVRRDAKVREQLAELGWRALVIWACQLNEPRLRALAMEIRQGK
ncbi:very short patch repair endonuclease [Frateuria hangzhouensis]|uniref:very short patch repair endonuclease n=1 Tax=Frateuria hangzhouensis TaxID=2995589 RepID=UPI0022608A37|nr:very short patch repair endonuclease [Frateuria sp. STR12]MCX7513443.1 very short patch repair endonuclease [Frateuria sp. STR12]